MSMTNSTLDFQKIHIISNSRNKNMTTKLKPAIKKLWVNALRSNNYKQGQRLLHQPEDNTFCCLGVLCDIHRKVSKKGKSEWKAKTNTANTSYKGASATLPLIVATWAFQQEPKAIPYIPSKGSLAKLNDEDKLSFTQIADLIERYF